MRPTYVCARQFPSLLSDNEKVRTESVFPPISLTMTGISTQEDVVLPLSSPVTGVDGTQIHELVLPAGTLVWPNVFWVNRDPEIWGPDAAEWKPERWLGPLPESLTEAHVPSVFAHTMTFAAGPRSCMCVLSLSVGSVYILNLLVIS